MSTRVVHIFAIKYAVAFSAIRLPVHKTWWNGSLGNASPSVDYEMRDWRKYFNMYRSSSGEWARERDRRSKSTKAAKGKGRERKSVPMSACIRIQIHNMLMQQHGDALCTYPRNLLSSEYNECTTRDPVAYFLACCLCCYQSAHEMHIEVMYDTFDSLFNKRNTVLIVLFFTL